MLIVESKQRARRSAYSIVEVLVAMVIAGFFMMVLYSGISVGFATVSITRENLRATQIMLERMEQIRLFTWEQLHDTNYMARVSTDYYYPDAGTDAQGTAYLCQLIVTNAPLGTSYASNMALVTLRVSWTNGNIPRTREMSTYYTRHGLQTYIYY